ncbi:MAG TPA: hypothetical protein VD994_19285, partial [Prosthecobacter sp.]|nr:hypothetical protein [Prosthecobacter sp.]
MPSREETAQMEPFARLELNRILVVATAKDAERAARELTGSPVLGFDTEAKPTFNRGEVSGGPHVVQF